MKPLKNNIIVKVLEDEEDSKSILYVPDAAKGNTKIGEVVTINEDCEDRNESIKVGTKILFITTTAITINENDKDIILLKEDDVMCIIND